MKRKLCCHLKDKGIKFEVIIDEYFTNHVDIELLKKKKIEELEMEISQDD